MRRHGWLPIGDEPGHDVWVTCAPDDAAATPSAGVVDWRPTRRAGLVMNVAGLLAAVVGLAGYGALAIAGAPSGSFTIGGWDLWFGLLGTVGAIVVLALFHEALHGLAMLLFGARPRFGVGVAGGGLIPNVFTTSPGHLFTRTQYLVVALTPSVALTLLTVVLVGWGPMGGWLVVPAAIHLGGCVGDWWLVAQAVRHPANCRYEDLKDGLRVHLPKGSPSSKRG